METEEVERSIKDATRTLWFRFWISVVYTIYIYTLYMGKYNFYNT